MKKAMSLVLALTLALSLALPVSAAEGQGFSDVQNHYAKAAVETWSEYGVLKGYPDGSFQPDGTITRAEMAVVLDRVMGYQNTAENTFTDVPERAWYAQSVLHLVAEGILQGRREGLMLPSAPITRQEAFAALARSMSLEESEKAPGFTDDKDIADWAKGYVSAMKEAGYISGDKSGAVRPGDAITRAEVVTILNNMAAAFVNADGTYSADCKGNLIVNAHDVRLKDMTIEGDLIVADGVADGDVYLEKVTVKGDIILRGCGENSFHIMPGCVVGNIIVTKTTQGMIRLVNESGQTIPMIYVNDGKAGVVLDGDELGDVVIACDAPVTVTAKSVKNLSVTGNAALTIGKDTTVSSLELTASAAQATVTVEGKVTELINDAGLQINNKGTVASNTGSAEGGDNFVYYPTSSRKNETLHEVTIQLLAPVFAAIPDEADPLGRGFTAKTQWLNADGTPASYRWKAAGSTDKDTFTADQAYQAVVTLTPGSRYTFADDLQVTVTDGKEPATEYTPVSSEKSGNNWVVTLTYEPTAHKEFVEDVRVSGVSALGINETGKLTVGYKDNYLVDPAGRTYQWYKCGDAAGIAKTAIAGATAKEYEIPAADTASEGKIYYCCDVTEQGKTYSSAVAIVDVQSDELDLSTVQTPVLPEQLDIYDNIGGGGTVLGVWFYVQLPNLIKYRKLSYWYSVSYTGSITYQDGTVEADKGLEMFGNSGSVYVGEDGAGSFSVLHGDVSFWEDAFYYGNSAYSGIKSVEITQIEISVVPRYNYQEMENCRATKVYEISDDPIRYHLVRFGDNEIDETLSEAVKAAYPCDGQYLYKISQGGQDDVYQIDLLNTTESGLISLAELQKCNAVGRGLVEKNHTIYTYNISFHINGFGEGINYLNGEAHNPLYGYNEVSITDTTQIHTYLEYRPGGERDYYYYWIDPFHYQAGYSFENM